MEVLKLELIEGGHRNHWDEHRTESLAKNVQSKYNPRMVPITLLGVSIKKRYVSATEIESSTPTDRTDLTNKITSSS